MAAARERKRRKRTLIKKNPLVGTNEADTVFAF